MSDGTVTRRTFVSGAAAGGVALMSLPDIGVGQPAALSAIVIGAVPALAPGRSEAEFNAALTAAKAAGVSAAVVPVIGDERRIDAMEALLRWRRRVVQAPTSGRIGSESGDWAAARRQGRVVLIAHSHGLRWLDRDLELLEDFRVNGLRLAKLSSGWRSLAIDGGYEATDLGVTRFGRKAVVAMERAGIVIDLACAGRKSSLEVMGSASRPVVFSHVNAAAVHPHPLNVSDEQARACARTGGVIAVSAVPALLGSGDPSVDLLFRHLDHLVRLVGIEHVAMGLDFDARPLKRYPTDPWPDPPYRYPTGAAGFGDLAALGTRLGTRFGAAGRAAVMGGNWERVFRLGWRAGD